MINAKKRFEILKRDNFKCQYCWKTWKDVSLEIDHIIPKSKWWTDDVENLVTCCRECNMWKWKTLLNDNQIRKNKVQEAKENMKKQFTFIWNAWWLWTIEKKTFLLLANFIENRFENMLFHRFFDWNKLKEKWKKEFVKWWKQCDLEIHDMSNFIYSDIEKIIEEIVDDDCWTWWNSTINDEWIADIRLNYLISQRLVQMEYKNKTSKESWMFYFVLKNTYRKDLIDKRFNS